MPILPPISFAIPCVGGYRPDLERWELPLNAMEDGTDVIWPRGVACLRGPWNNVLTNQVFGAVAGDDNLEAVWVHRFNPADRTEVSVFVVSADLPPEAGFADGSGQNLGAIQSGTPTLPVWPRCSYLGEIICCPQNGLDPLLRVGTRTHPFAADSTPTGSVTVVANRTDIAGTGTAFTTEGYVGAYITLSEFEVGINTIHYRVVKIDSTTAGSIDLAPAASSVGSTAYKFSRFGKFSLLSTVQKMGIAETAGASAVLGTGTAYSAGAVGHGAAAIGDLFGSSEVWNGASVITAIGGATDLTLDSASLLPTATKKPSMIARNLAGREACVHKGQLFVANLAWAPNRLQWLIAGESPSRPDNGLESLATNYFAARLADYAEVPDPMASGHIEALVSVPEGPLLILRSNNCFLGWNLPPTMDFDELDPGAGCVDKRSAAFGQGGAYWVGRDGVYNYRGGRSVVNIASGHISSLVRALLTDFNPASASTFVAGEVFDGHYFMSIVNPAGSFPGLSTNGVTLAYNILSETWSPPLTGSFFRYIHAGNLDDDDSQVFAVPHSTGTGLGTFQLGGLGVMLRDEELANDGDNKGTFTAELPSLAAGGIDRIATPTDAKVTAEVKTAGTTNLEVHVESESLASSTADATIAGNSTGTLQTVLAEPVHDVAAPGDGALGREVREARVRVAQTGATAPSAVRLHRVELRVRARRQHA